MGKSPYVTRRCHFCDVDLGEWDQQDNPVSRWVVDTSPRWVDLRWHEGLLGPGKRKYACEVCARRMYEWMEQQGGDVQ